MYLIILKTAPRGKVNTTAVITPNLINYPLCELVHLGVGLMAGTAAPACTSTSRVAPATPELLGIHKVQCKSPAVSAESSLRYV